MSLRVWLPLDGDLRNQGASSASVTNTGTITRTLGKIGPSQQFGMVGTGKSYLKFNNMDFIHDFTECSITLWINILSWNTSYATYFQLGLGSTPWAHYIFGLLRNNDASTLCFTISNGSSATNANCLTPALDLDTWYHLTLIYADGHCKIYVNGIETNDYSTTIVPNFAGITTGIIGACNNGNNYQTYCLMNDFRIYDHCLSVAEIHEIAQGLILHYKLDNICTFTDLIARNTPVGVYNNHGETNNPTTVTYLSSQYRGDQIINYTATPNSNVISHIQTVLYSQGIYGWYNTFKANTKYVFWIYYKPVSHSDIRCGGTASNIGGWTEIPPIDMGNGWYRVGQYRDGTVTENKSGDIYVSYKAPSAQANDTITIYFAAPHLVEGTTEIPPYDYPSIIAEDSSGYNHNGEIFGDLITTADTKRYSYGTKWNCSDPTTNNAKGKCYIKAPLALSSPLQMSVSWWAKPENGYGGSTSHAAFCTSVKQRPTDYNSTAMHHRDAGFDLCSSSGSSIRLTFNQYTANQWHHYVITYDGQTARAYKDGTELASASMAAASTLKSFTDVWIGYSQAGGVQRKTLGTYSDFRVYCTALSAQDIKQLYELGMKIDNDHNLHAFEVVENNNKISLNNKRQFKCDEVVESEFAKFFKREELVEVHQIVEC